MPEQTTLNVDFLVDERTSGRQRSFDSFDEAAAFAVQEALHKEKAYVDICVYDAASARVVGLEEAYKLDPDASVHERVEITANVKGSIP